MIFLFIQESKKSYADLKRKDISFSVGDLVFLKVSPMEGVMRFNKKGKLTPRYCHDPKPGVMTGARERELLYPEPVASLKIKTLNIPLHKNVNELKLFVIIIS